MFVISQSSSYKWPIAVEFPVDGGRVEKQTFDGEFRRLSQTRIEEIRTHIEAGGMTDRDFARDVLVGWSGVVDGGGEPVPFSEATRDSLLDVPLVSSAIVRAFMESLAGARRKN